MMCRPHEALTASEEAVDKAIRKAVHQYYFTEGLWVGFFPTRLQVEWDDQYAEYWEDPFYRVIIPITDDPEVAAAAVAKAIEERCFYY